MGYMWVILAALIICVDYAKMANSIDMVLVKVHKHHWILGNTDIKYNNSFGNSGWYIPALSEGSVFPETYDTLEEALSIVIGKPCKVKQKMSPPAGLIKE